MEPAAGSFRVWNENKVKVNENSVGILYFLAIYSKYLSAYIFENRIIQVYKQTAIDWQSFNEKNERDILHKFSQEGRFLTIVFVSYSVFAVIIFNSFPLLPLIMDTLFPRNTSRPRVYTYNPYYYFIDADKYHYELLIFHGSIAVTLSTLAVAAIDSMIVANIKHSCGLFAIVCYRLENIGHLRNSEKEDEFKVANDKIILQNIKKVCDMHRASLKSVDMLEHSFNVSFLIVMIGCVIAIALLMFQTLYYLHNPIKIALALVLLLGIKICLFYMNWSVQQVINSSEEVFTYAYYSSWYNLSCESRKFISIIQQKSMKPCSLSAGAICDLNLAKFAAVVRTSMSYATVMLSMQGNQ